MRTVWIHKYTNTRSTCGLLRVDVSGFARLNRHTLKINFSSCLLGFLLRSLVRLHAGQKLSTALGGLHVLNTDVNALLHDTVANQFVHLHKFIHRVG